METSEGSGKEMGAQKPILLRLLPRLLGGSGGVHNNGKGNGNYYIM